MQKIIRYITLRRAVLLALLLLSIVPALEAQHGTTQRHRLLSEMPEKERNEHLIAIAKEVYARPEYKSYLDKWGWGEFTSVEEKAFIGTYDDPTGKAPFHKAKKGELGYEVAFHIRTRSWMKNPIRAVVVTIYNCDASPALISFDGSIAHILNEPSRYPLKK